MPELENMQVLYSPKVYPLDAGDERAFDCLNCFDVDYHQLNLNLLCFKAS
jgi:hypothetical protein